MAQVAILKEIFDQVQQFVSRLFYSELKRHNVSQPVTI